MSRQSLLLRTWAGVVVIMVIATTYLHSAEVSGLSLSNNHDTSSQRSTFASRTQTGKANSPLSLSSSESSRSSEPATMTTEDRRAFLVKVSAAVVGASSMPSLASAVEASPPSSLPMSGAKAPDFELPNSRGTGEVTTLNTLTKTGKWTVLYFYPGAFSSGCTLEARGFQKDLDEYRKLNAQIVGVSVDPVEKNAQFCTEEKLDFFMLSDRGGIVSKKYGSSLSIPGFGTFSNRQTYIIDPKGELKWIFTDVESRIARHSAEVLDKLKELEQQTA